MERLVIIMKELEMYMVTHKDVDFIPDGRTPIFVGSGVCSKDYIRDNTGENIAEKNLSYCELTALYWVWKNNIQSKYISFEHYRRFFMNGNIPSVLPYDKMCNLLKEFDVVTTNFFSMKSSLRDIYARDHIIDDLITVEKVIKSTSPDYSKDFEYVMNNSSACMCNMFASKKNIFNEYCNWLFSILIQVEDRININGRDKYQTRVYGFLAERLQNVWLHHQNLNVKGLPIYYLEDTKFKSVLKSMKHAL